MILSLRERLERYTMPEPNSGCWIWIGGRTPFGHGRIARPRGPGQRAASRMVGAHVATYEVLVGPIPAGQVVRHRCDQPWCVNPAHLVLGTQADNLHDMFSRGRQVTTPRNGVNNGRARFTPAQVAEMRQTYWTTRQAPRGHGRISTLQLATRYRTSRSHMYRIVTGQAWR
jgi:hypothetical protein